MSSFVLDCSVTLARFLPDESNRYADAVFNRLRTERALVPAIWHYELANALVQAERRKRLSPAQSMTILDSLKRVPILTDDPADTGFSAHLITIARQHCLSAYDAAYLELSMRTGLPLASIDKPLVKAASTAGVQLIRS